MKYLIVIVLFTTALTVLVADEIKQTYNQAVDLIESKIDNLKVSNAIKQMRSSDNLLFVWVELDPTDYQKIARSFNECRHIRVRTYHGDGTPRLIVIDPRKFEVVEVYSQKAIASKDVVKSLRGTRE